MIFPANHKVGDRGHTADTNALEAAVNGLLEQAARNRVVLIGDSITASWGSHTTPLGVSLGREFDNLGVGGQGTLQIAARQGGAPALLTVAGNTIPASGPVSVTARSVSLLDRPSDGTYTLAGTLAGVAGTLTLVQSGAIYTYTFTRTDAGVAMPCPPGTPFITGFAYQDDWPIIWPGRNDIGSGVWRIPKADFLAAIRKMLAWNRHPSRALILSTLPRADQDSTGTASRVILDELTDALRTEFPTAFFDIAAWLRTDAAFQAAGIVKTAQDTTDIGNGLTPSSFRSDIVHLNATGYVAVNAIIPRVLAARDWDVVSVPAIDAGAPATLHSNGVAGAIHRFVPAAQSTTTGVALTSLVDQIGTATLTEANVGPSLTLESVSGERVLTLPAQTSGSPVASKHLQVVTSVAGPFTMAIVMKSTATAQNVLIADGFRLLRASNGTWQFAAAASGGGTGFVTVPGSDGWVVAIGVCDGTNSRLRVDGTTSADAGTITGPAASLATQIRVGNSFTLAVGQEVRIAEINIWPTALDATQRAAHITAMKARWTVLPA